MKQRKIRFNVNKVSIDVSDISPDAPMLQLDNTGKIEGTCGPGCWHGGTFIEPKIMGKLRTVAKAAMKALKASLGDQLLDDDYGNGGMPTDWTKPKKKEKGR